MSSALPVCALATIIACSGCASGPPEASEDVTMTRQELQDRIKGGWAGQVIGVTYGGPTEFQFNGTFMGERDPIEWHDGYIRETFTTSPGLYDDVYMDLTFVEVLEREGLDAPAASFARAFANAPYPLWHANQMARFNVLSGIEPPESGHWLNNPHADDIDFQIEADFAGLMSPAMPNTAAQFCDTVGHIMNYGDGYYGGVFVSGLYAEAFASRDIRTIITRALVLIPEESLFRQTIEDVIRWHDRYPTDWRDTWFEIQKKWSNERGCPDGVFRAVNIDARLNAAYVVMGLLYGDGDFGRTLSVATRAGQDSDCNPATAAGILGTAFGYEAIPDEWKAGLPAIEGLDFPYTSLSLGEVYDLSMQHALTLIGRGGGDISGDTIRIARQAPQTVPFEESFAGHVPVGYEWGVNQWASLRLDDQAEFSFTGIGFAMDGRTVSLDGQEHTVEVELFVDGERMRSGRFTTDFHSRTDTPFWMYNMADGPHTLRFVRRGADQAGAAFEIRRLVYYGGESGRTS